MMDGAVTLSRVEETMKHFREYRGSFTASSPREEKLLWRKVSKTIPASSRWV